jgi:hypothetical protein
MSNIANKIAKKLAPEVEERIASLLERVRAGSASDTAIKELQEAAKSGTLMQHLDAQMNRGAAASDEAEGLIGLTRPLSKKGEQAAPVIDMDTVEKELEKAPTTASRKEAAPTNLEETVPASPEAVPTNPEKKGKASADEIDTDADDGQLAFGLREQAKKAATEPTQEQIEAALPKDKSKSALKTNLDESINARVSSGYKEVNPEAENFFKKKEAPGSEPKSETSQSLKEDGTSKLQEAVALSKDPEAAESLAKRLAQPAAIVGAGTAIAGAGLSLKERQNKEQRVQVLMKRSGLSRTKVLKLMEERGL